MSELLAKVVLFAARARARAQGQHAQQHCLSKAQEGEAQHVHANGSNQKAVPEPPLRRMWRLIECSIVELLHDKALEQQPLFKAAICDLIRQVRLSQTVA